MTRGAVDRVLLITVCAGYGVVALAAFAQRSEFVTTHAAESTPATFVFVAAGLGLLTAGCLACLDRATGMLWALCVMAAVAWLSPALVGWAAGPALARSVGMVLAPFLLPLLVHLLLTAPSGGLRGLLPCATVAGAYGLTAAASVALAATRDPFLDRYCWSNCTDNVFLLISEPSLARLIGDLWLRAAVALALLALLVAGWRLVAATAVARRQAWPIALPAALAIGAEIGYAVAVLRDPAENPEQGPFTQIFLLRATALTALAAGVMWLLVRRRRRRTAFVRLVNELDASAGGGSLRATLSRSFGDSSLSVAYWLPRDGRYVDAAGQPVDPRTGRDRAVTAIVRGGERVAVISHERGTVDEQVLRHRLGPAALLAIDNERLGAELLAHLHDLRASRARIVAAADDVRQRIERDLHDGAQQILLAVLFELRLARHDVAEDEGRAAVLDAMITETQRSLAELRALAHGIFPAILDESGLGPALWTLAEEATVPVDVTSVPGWRLPAPAERTAYLVVTETLASVRTGPVTVDVDVREDSLVVGIGGVADRPAEYLIDRVVAVGGGVTYGSGTIRAEIPCG